MSVKIYEKRVEVVDKDSRARIIYKVECPMPLVEQRKKLGLHNRQSVNLDVCAHCDYLSWRGLAPDHTNCDYARKKALEGVTYDTGGEI